MLRRSAFKVTTFNVSPAMAEQLLAGLWYMDVHSSARPDGEIRGQIVPLSLPSGPQSAATASGGVLAKSVVTADGDLLRMILVQAEDDGWRVLGGLRQAPFGLSFHGFRNRADRDTFSSLVREAIGQ